MRLIYTNENRLLVGNAKNILEAHGIEVFLKNEFSQSAIGETSPLDTWPELWLLNDSAYEEAHEILESSLADETAPEWTCSHCGESNAASFEICWSCQSENS
jgi:hypothetical protein